MSDSTPLTDLDLDALLREQRRCFESGTPIQVETLLERHTELRQRKEALLDLINHEIVLRGEFATPPKQEEYLSRFPELATDLHMLFEVHAAIEAESVDEFKTVTDPRQKMVPLTIWPSVPNYQIIELLGEGGMGIVYKAFDQRLKRTVALKMIRGSRASPEDLRRFRSEAEAVAKLDRPGIVHIYEFGEHEQEPFFALEYVDGGSLSGHLNGQPQAPAQAARLVEDLARSVAEAHRLGIIHRDLKPGNILLQRTAAAAAPWVRDGVGYQPKIADFGLAKQVLDANDSAQTRAIVGTPSYMAPEQAGEFGGRLGPCADVYALGAILYELLTGRAPFRGESVLDTLEQVRTQDPIPPTRLQPKAPRDLETICLKCLRKDPAGRYPSAEALADDLGRFLRHEPILARPVGMLETARLWCVRRPAQAALLTGSIVGVIVFVGLAFWALLEHAVAGREETQRRAQEYDVKIKLAQRDWRENRVDRLQAGLDALRPLRGEPDLRDFEWHYLAGLAQQSLPKAPATLCLAYSPDGTVLAAGAGKEIHLWKAADLEKPNPQPFAKLIGHDALVECLAFGPKGRQLISSARDRTVHIWDVAAPTTMRTLKAHPADVKAVAFHPTDGSAATACGDRVIRVWEPDEIEPRLSMDEHAGSVTDIAFTPDGRRLVSSSTDKSVIIWNVATGDMIHRLRHPSEVLAVAVNGGRIATAGNDAIVRIWDADKGALLRTCPAVPQIIRRLAFSRDGTQLAAACPGKPIYVWDATPGGKPADEPPRLLRGADAVALAHSPVDDRLASVGKDGMLRIWDPRRDQECTAFNLPKSGGKLALAPGRPIVAVIGVAVKGGDDRVHLWNWRTGEHQELAGHTAALKAIAFSRQGTLASAAIDGKVCIWDIDQVKKLSEFAAPGKVNAVAFEGAWLATGDDQGIVQFWQSPAGAKLHQAAAHQGPVHDLALSPDGQRLASVGDDGAVIVCESATGTEIRRFHDAGHTPVRLAFSADGRFLAAGDEQYTIRVWDVSTGKRIYLFEGHEGSVNAVVFSGNGRRLASAGGIGDGAVKLWDLTTGLELLTLRGHGREVVGVVFAPDDEALISVGRTARFQGQLRVWHK
jgi:WD40 repeat protein